MSILNYFFMGTAFTLVIDLLLGIAPIKNLKTIKWGMKERITCILIWPISTLVFIFSLLRAIFRK